MLNELISDFALWLSISDESQVYKSEHNLSYENILITVSLGDEVQIKDVYNIDNDRPINLRELNMNVELFLEIATKLLKNRKKELQKQRIIELGNEE